MANILQKMKKKMSRKLNGFGLKEIPSYKFEFDKLKKT